jgi:hypothetical protein
LEVGEEQILLVDLLVLAHWLLFLEVQEEIHQIDLVHLEELETKEILPMEVVVVVHLHLQQMQEELVNLKLDFPEEEEHQTELIHLLMFKPHGDPEEVDLLYADLFLEQADKVAALLFVFRQHHQVQDVQHLTMEQVAVEEEQVIPTPEVEELEEQEHQVS